MMGWSAAKCLMILSVFCLFSCGEDPLPASAPPVVEDVETPKIKNRAEQKIEEEGLGLIETLSGPDGEPTFYVVRGSGVGNKYALDENGNEVSIPFAEEKVNEAWEVVTGKMTRQSYRFFEKSSPETKFSMVVVLNFDSSERSPDFDAELRSKSEVYRKDGENVYAVILKEDIGDYVLKSDDVMFIYLSVYGARYDYP